MPYPPAIRRFQTLTIIATMRASFYILNFTDTCVLQNSEWKIARKDNLFWMHKCFKVWHVFILHFVHQLSRTFYAWISNLHTHVQWQPCLRNNMTCKVLWHYLALFWFIYNMQKDALSWFPDLGLTNNLKHIAHYSLKKNKCLFHGWGLFLF